MLEKSLLTLASLWIFFGQLPGYTIKLEPVREIYKILFMLQWAVLYLSGIFFLN